MNKSIGTGLGQNCWYSELNKNPSAFFVVYENNLFCLL